MNNTYFDDIIKNVHTLSNEQLLNIADEITGFIIDNKESIQISYKLIHKYIWYKSICVSDSNVFGIELSKVIDYVLSNKISKHNDLKIEDFREDLSGYVFYKFLQI